MPRRPAFILCFLLLTAGAGFAQPADPAALFQQAVALQQQGKFDEAAAYRAVLKRKPDYIAALANPGVVLARQGKYNEAITAYETAYKLAPQLTPILLNLGIAHYRARQFAKAIAAFQPYLDKVPASVQARQLYGLSLAALSRDEEAIAQLEQTPGATTPTPAANSPKSSVL
ncbi:MAG: tetratricopeptide repeat protein [Blastocatellia bacterium]